MKEDNLNTFKNYQTYATYQSRTILPDLRQSFQNTQEYTRPEIMRVHQKLDQMLESLEKFTPSLLEQKKEIQNNSQLETQLPPSQYGTQRPQSRQQLYQQEPQMNQSRIPQQMGNLTTTHRQRPQLIQPQFNKSLQSEFDEYLQFKEFMKAKNLVLTQNSPLSDMYKYYLENDVYEKTRYYRIQEDKVNRILLRK